MGARVIIALGSNLGNRLAHLQRARNELRALALHHRLLQSSVYQTEPVLCPQDSPDFLNAVVSFDYEGTPTQLHRQTRAIESAMGRSDATPPNAPRVIDLDVLLFGDEIAQQADLCIPHPRLHLRRFVLQPLCDIHPQINIPGLEGEANAHLAKLDSAEAALQLIASDW